MQLFDRLRYAAILGSILIRGRTNDVSLLYETKIGIKSTNQLIDSLRFSQFVRGEVEIFSLEMLSLGFDGLNDNFTLIGRPLQESPHRELMQMLSQGSDISRCEYIQRVSIGSLDFRRARPVSGAYLQALRDAFQNKLQKVTADNYDPIKIVNVGGVNFIADGKHTAAVCSLLGISPRCVDVSPVFSDSFIRWVYAKMLRSKGSYDKHKKIFRSIDEEWMPIIGTS